MDQTKPRPPWLLGLIGLVVAALTAMWGVWWFGRRPAAPGEPPRLVQDWFYVSSGLPEEVRRTKQDPTRFSNIAPADYVGPQTCAKCHEKNYQNWSQHAHRWMNAEATAESVKGRFDGTVIPLRGGEITVYRAGENCRMRVQRGDVDRDFRITQTIGSRYQQYYIGVLEKGTPLARRVDNARVAAEARSAVTEIAPDAKVVLPVGYRIARDQWVPIYGVYADNDDDFTPDPYENFTPITYYASCAKCHTTMPQGYRILLDQTAAGLQKPRMHFDVQTFLSQTSAAMTDAPLKGTPATAAGFDEMLRELSAAYRPEKAVTLGISCEACHYGGKEHVESNGRIPPRFLPSSPHLVYESGAPRDYGRTVANQRLVCAQCHSPPRLTLPGGASRLNSSEYRDAISGGCYSQLSCVHCHEPHTTIGPKWTQTPEQDDGRCLACHKQYEPVEPRAKHTHHRSGSTGARCMNCHMPHMTEGIEDVVRTHQISSPTNRAIIEEGGTNACNLCHLDKPIDWTVEKLSQWYGATFDRQAIARVSGGREQPMGRAWLEDRRYEIRRIGIGAVRRMKARWLTPDVVKELDDVHDINRQFAVDCLEDTLGIDVGSTGYYYWMTPPERNGLMEKLRALVRDAARAEP